MTPRRSCGIVLIGLTMMAEPARAGAPTMDRHDLSSTSGARGIAAADFNRDGWIDFVTAHHDPDGVSVLRNRGRAGGYIASFIPLPGGPFDVATGDLNKDGIPDIAVANADANAIDVLIGRGDGTFDWRFTSAGRANPRAVTIADMNRDGHADLIFTEFTASAVTIQFGTGTGSFGTSQLPSVSVPVGTNPQGVAVTDFNLDGWPDIVAANTTLGGLTVLYAVPGTSTYRRSDLDVPPQQNVVTTGDFDRDGRPDVAAASTSTSDVTIWLNKRNATSVLVYSSGGGSPRGIVAADLDRDGVLDIVTGNRATSTLELLPGNGDGTFGAATAYAAGSGSRVVAAGDFDHDGRVDLVSGNEFAATMTVLSNTTVFPRAGFAFRQEQLGPRGNGFSGPESIDVADFDHDGRLDAVTDNSGLIVLLADGRTTRVADSARGVSAADVNRDGNPDIVALNRGLAATDRSRIEVFFGDGTGGFTGGRTTATSIIAFDMGTGDVNGDGRPDVVLIGTGDPTTNPDAQIHVFVGDGDGRFTVWSTNTIGRTFTSLAMGDLDRDGDLDFVAYRNGIAIGTTTVLWWLNDGDGSLGGAHSMAVDAMEAIYGASLGDVNHDGYLDFAGAGNPRVFSSAQRIAVLLGGPAGFGQPTYLTTTESVLGTAIADVTLDGNPDVIGDNGLLFAGNGDGTFPAPSLFDFYVPETHVVDFNRDGLPDLVGPYSIGAVEMILNERRDTNLAPAVNLGPDVTFTYGVQFADSFEFELWARPTDPDLHKLTFVWRDEHGSHDTGTFPFFSPARMLPGTYEVVVEASDGRGGTATDSIHITVLPEKEIVLHIGDMWSTDARGDWQIVNDPSAGSGRALHDVNRGAPKVTTPLVNPVNRADIGFAADPTQTYKLWVRLKADGNQWANDSIWLQFTGAVDSAGRSVAPGTASGIEVNLEECSGCGEAGWGWRDEAWGQRDAIGTLTLRFPQGGWQTIRVQTREDGVSVDQIVLSSEKYLTARPGAVKNDNTILPRLFY